MRENESRMLVIVLKPAAVAGFAAELDHRKYLLVRRQPIK
jgi:hypothetical protein